MRIIIRPVPAIRRVELVRENLKTCPGQEEQ